MNIPDHISESLSNIFLVRIRIPDCLGPGSGTWNEKIRIREKYLRTATRYKQTFVKMLCASNPNKFREMYRRENKEVKRMKQK